VSLLGPLEGVLGLLVVGSVLLDIFYAVVVPRRAPRTTRLSSYVTRWLWRAWVWAGTRLQESGRREGFLGSYGSATVMVLLVGWLAILMVGFGLMLDSLKAQLRPEPESLTSSIYFAGEAMLTIGFGDVVAVEQPARLITLAAGATGLGVFAVVLTFLFSIYGSFQRREVAVVVLEAGAGAPPSGVTLLETYALAGIMADLPRLFEDWQAWAAEVLDSHLAYPILAYFRSSHDNDSWISALGAVMDAATLVLTTLDGGPKGWAKLTQTVGGHCLEDMAQYFRLPDPRDDPFVDRSEFDEACRRLAAAGLALRPTDEAWARFSHLRSTYAGRVNALAAYFASPPAQWIGDRSPLREPGAHRASRR